MLKHENPRRVTPARRRPHYLDVWRAVFDPVYFPVLHHVAGMSVDQVLALAGQLKIRVPGGAARRAMAHRLEH